MSLSKGNKGFTLLEVMVAVLILAIGLLGLAQLQVTTLKTNQSSYLRSQASNLAADIFDRMRANQTDAQSGKYSLAMNASPPATPSTIVQTDISEWLNQLSTSLPDGDGSISCTDADTSDGLACSPGSIYTITVQWTELQKDCNKGTTSFVYTGAL